jgi:ParB/RepB/Spo0J family partition protein
MAKKNRVAKRVEVSDGKPVKGVEMLPIEVVKPYWNNPRIHKERAVSYIARSIKEYGFCVPIIVDENNEIIAGHGRYLAAKKLGLREVPALRIVGWSEERKRSFRIADNRVAQYSGWDEDKLYKEILDLLGKMSKVELAGQLGMTEMEVTRLMDKKEGLDEIEGGGAFEVMSPLQLFHNWVVIVFEEETDWLQFQSIAKIPPVQRNKTLQRRLRDRHQRQGRVIKWRSFLKEAEGFLREIVEFQKGQKG